MSELRAVPGTVLAASPDLPDSSFSHATVLICEHAAEGAFGLVFNRPAGISLRQVFPEHPLLVLHDQAHAELPAGRPAGRRFR